MRGGPHTLPTLRASCVASAIWLTPYAAAALADAPLLRTVPCVRALPVVYLLAAALTHAFGMWARGQDKPRLRRILIGTAAVIAKLILLTGVALLLPGSGHWRPAAFAAGGLMLATLAMMLPAAWCWRRLAGSTG